MILKRPKSHLPGVLLPRFQDPSIDASFYILHIIEWRQSHWLWFFNSMPFDRRASLHKPNASCCGKRLTTNHSRRGHFEKKHYPKCNISSFICCTNGLFRIATHITQFYFYLSLGHQRVSDFEKCPFRVREHILLYWPVFILRASKFSCRI